MIIIVTPTRAALAARERRRQGKKDGRWGLGNLTNLLWQLPVAVLVIGLRVVGELAELVQKKFVVVTVLSQVRLEAAAQCPSHAELLGHDERLQHHLRVKEVAKAGKLCVERAC